MIANKETSTAAHGSEPGTAVTLTVGSTVIRATLNNTAAAKHLKDRLPFKISLSRSEVDYCGTVAGSFKYASEDLHNGWRNGNIDYVPSGNWFAIFFGGENDSAPGFITMGQIDKADLPIVSRLGGAIEVTVALAK